MSDQGGVVTNLEVSDENIEIQRIDEIMRRISSIQDRLHSLATRLRGNEDEDVAADREIQEFIESLDQAYLELDSIDRQFNRMKIAG